MRKLLLATVAALGVTAGMSDVGYAQSADDDSGQAAAAPGTLTVRLNGRFRFYAGLVSASDADRALFVNQTTGAAAQAVPYKGAGNVAGFGATTATTGVGAPAAGSTLTLNKLTNYTFENYIRLYPGFDGVAANGLKYGASIEIRQDNNSGAGGGVYGSISQQARQRGELYIRREWGYMGTDQLGTLRFGATDGPSGLYMTGNFENFNDGGWNGDVNNLPPGNLQPTWPFADVGNLYTTNKVIYLSPQLYGFDVGFAFEPSTANVGLGASANCGGNNAIGLFPSQVGAATAGCDQLASTTTADYTRRMNTIDTALRYRGTFGPVGLASFVNYIGSGTVADAGNVASPTLAQRALQYDGLSVGVGGLTVSYAGFSVGGMIQGGRFNGQWNLAPQGAASGLAYLAGASYTYGPAIVGVQAYEYDSAGASGPAATFSPLIGQRKERGLAAGGTYSLAPGLALFLSYLYGDRKENGYDLLTGQTSTAASPTNGAQNNYVKTQVFTLGTSLTW